MDKLKARWSELQPRERLLLMLMGGVFGFLGIFVLYINVSRAIEEKQAEIEKYRQALYYLEDNAHTYAENKRHAEKERERLINGADIGVTAFLSKTATDIGFDVSVDPKKEAPASSKDDTGAMQQELQITIRSVDRNQLVDYLWSISQAEAPLYIQRLQINRARATGSQATDNTPLSASVTVISYRLDEEL